MARASELHSVTKTQRMLALLASILFAVSGVVASPQAKDDPDLKAAIKLLNSKDAVAAAEILKKIVNRNVNDAEAWYQLGIAYVQLKDMKRAENAFQNATRIKPGYAEAQERLAYVYLRRGKLYLATSAGNTALSLDPKSADAHFTMAVIALRSGNRDQTISHANLALQSTPTFAEAYLLKSQALINFKVNATVQDQVESKEERADRYREAATALEEYLKLAPDTENTKIWKAQMESLRVHANGPNRSDFYTPKQLTTKVRFLSKPEPEFTNEAREGQVKGTVVLKAVFASDGEVKHILIVQTLPGGLTEEAVRAAQRIRFVPATVDGKPVSMWIQLEYNFNL